jgi:murein L,D-transpeptidase YafK
MAVAGKIGWRMERSLIAAVLVVAVLTSAVAPARADSIEAGTAHAVSPPVLEIWKRHRLMQLREGDQVVRQFHIALGYSPDFNKRIQGDTRTPVGTYQVCEKNPASQYHRFLGINYPNVDDAERGYRERLISAPEWADIFLTHLRGGVPNWRTALGGRVGIHGAGGRRRSGDWTKGCIAVSDEEIEFLFARVPIGTRVIINE